MIRPRHASRVSTPVLAALLVAACSGSPSPAPSASAPTAAPPTAAATPGGPSTSAPSTSTGAPGPGAWQEAPAQPATADMEFVGLASSGSSFVAIASTEAGGTFVDSQDGSTWHRQVPGSGEWQPASIAAGDDRVAAVGTIGDAAASWVAPDGRTWTVRENAFPMPELGTDTVEVTDLVATPDGWLAVGRRDGDCFFDCGLTSKRAYVWTSTDGLAWTRIQDQDSLSGGGMVAVTRTAGGFVAVGVANGHAAIWTSPDGQAWSRVPDDRMFGPPGGAVIPEEPVEEEPPVAAVDVAVSNGVIVVIGQSYAQDFCEPARADPVCPGIRIWWSADGAAWSRADVAGARDGQSRAVTVAPDGFLAVGSVTGCASGIVSSADGRAWTCEATDVAFEGFVPAGVAASGATELVVGTTFFDDDDSAPPEATAWYRSRS